MPDPAEHQPQLRPRAASAAKKSTWLIYIFGALGGLNWGYDTGVISAALLYLREDLQVGAWIEGTLVAALMLGAVVGAAFGGYFSDKYGRRAVLWATAVVFIIGPVGMALSPEWITLTVFRFVTGIGAGLAALILPVYLSELSPARLRGRTTALYALAIGVGQFLGFVIGLLFAGDISAGEVDGWRWMLGLSVVPSLLFAAGLLFVWETPRWLVQKGREDEAWEILHYDRDAAEAEREMLEIKTTIEAERTAGRTVREALTQPWVKPALLIGLGLAFYNQFMGINTVVYYTPTVLQTVGFSAEDAVASNLIVGITHILAVIFAITMADRLGRRPLLLIGAAGAMISLAVLGIAGLTLLPSEEEIEAMEAAGQTADAGAVGVITLVCITLYIFMFQASWGSIVWVMLGEIFPLGVRAAAMCLATTALWAANAVVAFGFPPLLDAFGVGWVFLGLAVSTFTGLVFCWVKVPETKGRSLEEIEAGFRETGSLAVVPGTKRVVQWEADRPKG